MRRHVHAVGVLVATSSCSFVNKLDVCGTTPSPTPVNQHVDGEQTLESSQAIAVMPSGEAVVLFSSTVGTRPADDALEVRAVRLSSVGAPLDGCATRNEREQVLYPVPLADETPQKTRALQVVPAPNAMGLTFTGLTLLAHAVGDSSSQLIAMSIQPEGCFGSSSEPFVLNEQQPDRALATELQPKAVALPIEGGTQPYATFWVENSTTFRRAAMVRLVRVKGGFVLPTVTLAAPDGESIDLELPGGPIIVGLDAIATGTSEITVVWAAANVDGSYALQMGRYDFELQRTAAPVVLLSGLSLGSSLGGARLLAAFDGARILILCARGMADGTTRLVAQSFLPDGRAAGPPHLVGGAVVANDSFASLTALPKGGFVIAWRQQLSGEASQPGGVGLRMTALDTYGRTVFNNIACHATDFELFAAGSGDIQQSSLTLGPDGRVLVAFGHIASSSSLSLSDVSLISLAPKDIFPSGELRPTTDDPPAVGPPPAVISAGHPSCDWALAGHSGLSCTCADTCDDPGAICRAEELSGRAGGFCHLECDPTANGSCPDGSTCSANAKLDKGGLCQVECQADADCGLGRVCFAEAKTCWYLCATASDCRSGTCDAYTGACGTSQSNPQGGGLAAPCVDGVDCRSLDCTPSDHPLFPKRCESFCRVDHPGCPDDGACIRVSGNLGICAPSCEDSRCPAGLDCFELPGYSDVPVCLAP